MKNKNNYHILGISFFIFLSCLLIIPLGSWNNPGTVVEGEGSPQPLSSTAIFQPTEEDYPIFYISKFDPLRDDYGWWVEFSFTAYTTDITREDAVTVSVLVNNEDKIWQGTAAHFDEETVYAKIKETPIIKDGLNMSVNVTCTDFEGRSKSYYKVITFDVQAPRKEYVVVSSTLNANKTIFNSNDMVELDWQSSVKVKYRFTETNFESVIFYLRESLDDEWEQYGTIQTTREGYYAISKEWVKLSKQIYEETWYLKVTATDKAGNFVDCEFIMFFSVPESERPLYNEEDLEDAEEKGRKEGLKDLYWTLGIAIPLTVIIILMTLLASWVVAKAGDYGPMVKSVILQALPWKKS